MKHKHIYWRLLIIIFWLFIWKICSSLLGKPLLLPAPEEVIAKFCELAVTAEFWSTIINSLFRIVAGITAAIVLGVMIAVITSCSKIADMMLSPVFALIKATPVASFTILVLIWLNRDYVPVFISGLMVFPVIWANISAGIQNTSSELLEMAKVYRLSVSCVVRRIFIPSVKPYFLSACRSAIGFGWKAGIAAEVLTVPGYSIGRMIYESKLYLQTTELFAWTAAVVLLSIVLEKAVLAVFGGKNDNIG